jgi:hypothetical protein
MEKDGTMNTEQTHIEQTEQNLKEELLFTDKERDCEECEKEKEVQLSFGLSTKQE